MTTEDRIKEILGAKGHVKSATNEAMFQALLQLARDIDELRGPLPEEAP